MNYFVITVFGVILGSFVNVVAYRIPIGKPIVNDRSQCRNCKSQIAWYDLIPVISFIILGAHCRKCHDKISWVYPLVEVSSGLIFLASYYYFQSSGLVSLFFTVFILEILLTLFVTDLTYLILPDIIILTGVIGVVAYGVLEKINIIPVNHDILSVSHLVSAFSFSAVLYVFWLVSKGTWIGLGDAKLIGMIGLVFGYIGTIYILYLGVALGGIIGLFLLLFAKADRKTKLPLGSFICLSAVVYIFTSLSLAQRLGLELIFR